MDIAITAGLLILCRYISAYNAVSRCPLLDKEIWKSRGREICKLWIGQRYHCFKRIDGSFVEMCIKPRGLWSRECPYFDPSSRTYFKYRKCDERYGLCPTGDVYTSYYIYRYSACLYSPTTIAIVHSPTTLNVVHLPATVTVVHSPTTVTVVHSSSDYNEGMTPKTASARKQITTRMIFNVTATSEHEIKDVTISKKLDENQKTQESSMIFGSEIFKGILALTGGILIASVCVVIYMIRRKNQMNLRMTYSNAVAFKDNTENVYEDIAEAPLEIPNNNTSSLEQSAHLEPHEGLLCHIATSCHRLDVSEKENKDMQICDAEMEEGESNTEVKGVKDTSIASSLLGFL